MSSAIALVRASWQTTSSYRVRMLLSILSLGVTIVPVYFVANALQPVMAESIRHEGGEYFAFLVLGMATFMLLPAAIFSIPDAVGGDINTGTFEALLGTPARLGSILIGLSGFSILWTGLRVLLLFAAAWLLGADLVWTRILPALVVLALIVLAHLPFGVLAAALVIAFRTTGPMPQGVLAVSALLGGVYYPTTVIPSWIRTVSEFVPLTYGLDALRGMLLEARPMRDVAPEIALLLLFAGGLGALAWSALLAALRHARRNGTLTQY